MDPAGLYLGILLKRRDPSHLVRFVDGSPQPSAPATIICNPIKPRLTLADAETLDAIKPAIVSFDRVSIVFEGGCASEFGGSIRHRLDRARQAFKQRASGLYLSSATLLLMTIDADLVVAADGPEAKPRRWALRLSRSSNRTVVFQSASHRRSELFLPTTEHGIFHAWKLPRGSNGSSVIVETPAETLRVSGLDRAPPECIIALCRKLFSLPLDRIVAAADGSIWESFTTVRNRPWHTGNVVLLGRAAYTSHGSVGLDLRSQLEDAEALAEHLSSSASIADALQFRGCAPAQRPTACSAPTLRAPWFEHGDAIAASPFEQFCFSLLTNSMRLTWRTHREGRARSGAHCRHAGGGHHAATNRPPPPMFARHPVCAA
jgi:hypothetical protein